MQPARQPAKVPAAAPVAAPPARPPVRKPPAPISSAAALQSRIGATGMKMLNRRAAKPARAGAKPGEPAGRKRSERDEAKAGGAAARPVMPDVGGGGAKAAGPAPIVPPAPEAQAAAPGPPVQLHMPEPPKGPSPATVKRIQGVQARAAGKAAAQADLPAAEKQVGDAQQAVTPPESERAARAQADLIAMVKAAPSPEIVALCQNIKKVIEEKRPVDEDALEEANPEAEAEDAGNQLNATVQGETQKVQDNYGAVETSPGAPPAPKVPDLPGQPEAAATPALNAAAAKPDAVPAEALSLDRDAAEARQKTEDAGMETPAAQLVKSGPIAEARAAQGELDETAKEDPAELIARQEQALGKAEADMASLGAEALAALTAARQGTARSTQTRQRGMVGTEESMRLKAGEEAQAAFLQAQTLVKGLLKDLPQKAMEEWEQAKKLLVDRFKNELAIVKKRVDERHAGFEGGLRAIGDYFVGLPAWATDAYTRAENNFADGVIEKLLAISTKVNAVIETCNQLIKTAREKIAKTFDSLPQSLRAWAEQEKAKFGRQLDGLEKEAADTRDNFNKGLKQQASAAVNEVRKEIAELRKKAGGLVGRIADAVNRFLDDPVKFIIEGLLELLGISPSAFWAVVAKIKKYTAAIADDPLGFGENLLKGLGQGFNQFFDNFGTHMIEGFLKWLFGDLKGVQVPKDFSLKSVIGFFLQLMGITWPNIRKILVKKVGAQNVALVEKVWSLVSLLLEKGPEGIVEMIKEMLDPQTILDQVIEMAVEYMVTAIVKQVAARLLLLFNPVGAILQALEAIYKVLKWVFQNAAKIFKLVETVVNGIGDIIAGNVAGFAGAVEKGLAMLIPPVIAFIADFFSLGDLPKAVADEIKSMQKWVLGMIERALDWVIDKGKALLAKMGIGKKEKAGPETVGEAVEFTAEDEPHRLWIEARGDNATIMVASVQQNLAGFLDSKPVQDAKKTEKSVPGLVAKAKEELKKVDADADGVLKALKQISEEQAAPSGSTASAQQNEKVKAEEHALATTLTEIFKLIKVDEPAAGLHGDLCQAPKTKQPRESHHVPAKGLAAAIGEFLGEAATELRSEAWEGNASASLLADQLDQRAGENIVLADPGDPLSAILISYETHKGELGVHSADFAETMADLGKEPNSKGLLFCKNKTARKIKEAKSYIAVNPKIPAWREFLADVRRQLRDSKPSNKPNEPRGTETVVEIILAEAEAEMSAADIASEAHLTRILIRINRTMSEAPNRGFETGKAIVAAAMEKNIDGTPAGQSRALAQLTAIYRSSWRSVRSPINKG